MCTKEETPYTKVLGTLFTRQKPSTKEHTKREKITLAYAKGRKRAKPPTMVIEG